MFDLIIAVAALVVSLTALCMNLAAEPPEWWRRRRGPR